MASASAKGLLNVASMMLATLPKPEIKKTVMAPSLMRTGALTAVTVALIDIADDPPVLTREAAWISESVGQRKPRLSSWRFAKQLD